MATMDSIKCFFYNFTISRFLLLIWALHKGGAFKVVFVSFVNKENLSFLFLCSIQNLKPRKL
jgi:hypothetical protein